VFFLAYGGLRWSYSEVLALPIMRRRHFVEILERQLDFEKQQMER